VPCAGPFEEFFVENSQEANMKKASASTGSSRERTGSIGSTGSFTTPSSGNKSSGINGLTGIDIKIDYLIRTVKEKPVRKKLK